jgi:hypothetical protein
MKNIYTTCMLVLAISGFISTSEARAQVGFNGDYSQNFSSMGTGTAAPTGWSVYSEAGSHATFAPSGSYTAGVSPNFTTGALSLESTLTVATPTQGTSGAKGVVGYNFSNPLATAGNGEGSRSLGSSPSGNAATILQLSLTNNTGSALNALSLSYDIDRFTTTVDNNGDSTTSPNYGVEEYPGYQLFYNLTPGNNSDWVNVSSLNPTIDAGAGGNVSVPNSVGITVVSPTTIQLASSWTAGSTLDLAWFDDNAESPSPDQQIGLNNVNVAVAPEPSAVVMLAVGGVALLLLAARRAQRA